MNIHELSEALQSRTRALEIMLVKAGLKRTARIATDNEEEFRKIVQEAGLAVEFSDYKVIMEFSGLYSTKGTVVGKNSPGHSFAYIAKKKDDAALAKQADAKQDIKELGRILGYPECCIEFFMKHREEEIKGRNDYVMPAVKNSRPGKHPFHLNVFARYFDFALISHAPHSLDCRKSLEIARQSMNLLFKEDARLAMAYQKAMTGVGIYGENFVLLLPGATMHAEEKRILTYSTVFSSPTESEAAKILRNANAAVIETNRNSTTIRTQQGSINVLAVEEFE